MITYPPCTDGIDLITPNSVTHTMNLSVWLLHRASILQAVTFLVHDHISPMLWRDRSHTVKRLTSVSQHTHQSHTRWISLCGSVKGEYFTVLIFSPCNFTYPPCSDGIDHSQSRDFEVSQPTINNTPVYPQCDYVIWCRLKYSMVLY